MSNTATAAAAERNTDIDRVQSEQYNFPYHYIPHPDGFPNFARTWRFAPSYVAALHLISDWLKGLNTTPPHRHMDYGCGDGGCINALERMQSWDTLTFEGVDYDPEGIRWAKAFSKAPENFHVADLRDLGDATYDSGTLIEVLEHIPPAECDGFIAEIARSLKPGAQLLVTVPSTEKAVTSKHYRHFDFETLTAAFAQHFEVVEIFGFEKTSRPLRLIRKCLMNQSLYVESRMTNGYMIRTLATKHRELTGCGRIGLVLRRRPSA